MIMIVKLYFLKIQDLWGPAGPNFAGLESSNFENPLVQAIMMYYNYLAYHAYYMNIRIVSVFLFFCTSDQNLKMYSMAILGSWPIFYSQPIQRLLHSWIPESLSHTYRPYKLSFLQLAFYSFSF